MAENKERNEWIEWGKAILIAIIFAMILKSFVFSTSTVEGESMDPTLVDGERLVFNKIVYLIGKPSRSDVVIIQSSYKNYVKRVIALPGETIEMIDHKLYINDQELNQLYISEEAKKKTGSFGPIDVPLDSYYVMGDNRAISMDSRNGLGFIKQENIIGRSEFVFFPLSEWSMTR